MLSLHDVMKLSNLTVRKIRFIMAGSRKYRQYEVVYVTIGNPAFYLFLYLTGGELQHVGDVSEPKIKCRPIRTCEIGGVTLSDVLYYMYGMF